MKTCYALYIWGCVGAFISALPIFPGWGQRFRYWGPPFRCALLRWVASTTRKRGYGSELAMSRLCFACGSLMLARGIGDPLSPPSGRMADVILTTEKHTFGTYDGVLCGSIPPGILFKRRIVGKCASPNSISTRRGVNWLELYEVVYSPAPRRLLGRRIVCVAHGAGGRVIGPPSIQRRIVAGRPLLFSGSSGSFIMPCLVARVSDGAPS